MCIAFPKAGDGGDQTEPTWKSLVLLIPRLARLLWLLLRILGGGLRNWLQERFRSPAR